MKSEIEADQSFKEDILREQVRLAMQQLPTMQATSFLVALVLSYTVRHIVSPWHIFLWLLMIAGIVGSRIVLHVRFLRVREESFAADYWERFFIALALVSGILWGGSAFLIFPSHNPGLIALFVLVIASLSAATTVSHSSIRSAPAAWAVPAMILYAFRCIWEGGQFGYTTGSLIVLYLFTVIHYSVKHNKTILSAITLKFENLALMREVQKGKELLERRVEERTLELQQAKERLTEEEGALKLQEERLRLAMEATQQGWFDLNVQSGQVTVSPEYAKIIGYEPSEFETNLQGWIEGLHPEDRESVLRVFRECVKTGSTRTMEYRRRTKTGDWKWIQSIGKIVEFDSHNKPLRMAGTHADISDRKRTQEALLESQERFKELAELLPETIFEMDDIGTITYVNRNAFDHFGFSQEDFDRGVNGFSMISPDGRPRAIDNAQRVMRGEKIGLNEYNIVRKDGSSFPAIVHTAAKFREGKPIGLRGIVIDISAQKRLEADLRRAHKMEAIGTLAGGIAHDFNNILAAIIGYTEMALNKIPESGPPRRYLDQVLRAGHRAKDLVRQILASSRHGESRERIPVEIASVVEDALKLLRASLPATIDIRQKIKCKTGVVLADPTEVHQVLFNLCTNAAHAMEEKGGAIEITLADTTIDSQANATSANLRPGDYLRLSVSDTGHGIDPLISERIFDPYFTTKEMGRGSGLGLALVDGIVKRHEGAITVDSEPGVGTIFHVYLPKVESTGKQEVEEFEGPVPRGTERVLFVDDEEILVELWKGTLEWLGYEVTATTSSLEALELFEAHPDRFDLVVTDYTMPHMTGVDLAKEIMRIRADVPVILCTGYSERITEERAKEMGIRAFAMKPLNMRIIAEMVRSVLDEKQNRSFP
jgi:PAS domain S-box-containing protein